MQNTANLASNNHLFMQLGLVTAVAILIGGFAVIPSYGQASSSTSRDIVSFQSAGLPLCRGENVVFGGNALILAHTTVSPDGTTQYHIEHVNYQGVKAVGVESGTTSPVMEVDISSQRQISENQYENTFLVHGGAITQGKPVNTEVTLVFHTTFNANGQPTANVSVENIRCVG